MNEINTDTFAGAVYQLVLNEALKFDMAASGWALLEEEERKRRADAILARCDEMCTQLIHDVLAAGAETIVGTVDQVVFKDGVKVVFKCSRVEQHRHAIADATGKAVLLMIPQLPLELTTAGLPPEQLDLPQ